ncbi:UbiH/UbiF/VisC/COQ6 family ubiquinone biosynthesis hydroxylase [Porticoccaceae bacterium]|nr:UbiH/UbiF/VisC/COQ6 family ubiquinone biosynthesis hydroxylase [Porticoccaceae bacterium]
MVRAKQQEYDMVIVGAGMVGATAASLLARVGGDRALKIALVEARTPELFNAEQFDPRVAAITEKSRQLLESAGLWQPMADKRISPYLRMDVWDAEGTGRIQFDSHDIHQSNLGHIVENSVVVESLLADIGQQPNIDLYCPAHIIDYENCEDRVTVILADGTRLEASLLIAADGAKSKVRQHFQFATREWDYGHSAIVTTIRTEQPNQKTAWQRFMPTGPLALLPLNNQGDLHHCSIVWSQETEVAARLMDLNDEQFCAELSRASEYCLGQVLSVDQRHSIGLHQRHATDYATHRVALLGDAAHSIHPLAGQGVNLGFADVAVLVDEIDRAVARRLDLGDMTVLGRYQRRRKPDNLATMAAMEGFKRLFAADNLPLRLLRNMGMSQLNEMSPVKNEIIKRAMGL